MTIEEPEASESRRSFVKKAAYVAPAILTVTVMPVFASYGSNSGYKWHGNNGVGNGVDPQPPGEPPVNDGPGTGPGYPGSKDGRRGGNPGARRGPG